ncbi:hypothetical protein T09_9633 [Trichinella sp. T9]|nr:hypothetical protein T09_9633 [Trichinella sp. T9]
MSCKSYGCKHTIYACETIHICVAAHAIWCGSYVFGGSEWPSGPSRVDQMGPPKVISAKIVRPARGLGGDDAVGVPGAGGQGKMQNLPHSVGQTKRTISPPLGAGKSTKLPAHLRQVKQLSLTRLFSAESLGFPRSREEERALCLPKEQGRHTIYACETIHICVAAHAIWCGSYVFGGSEWPSGPSRVDQMGPPKVISAKIVRPARGLGGDDAVGVPGAGGWGAARGRSG